MRVELLAPHPGQRTIIDNAGRFNVVMCGRRTGKTALGSILACETAIDGFPVGWFAPTYKYLTEAMREIDRALKPIIVRSDYTEKRVELRTGGVIEFWTLDNKDAGRSRKYKRAIIDEAGIVPDLMSIWQMAIRPTLTDFVGDGWLFGTPRGGREFQQMFEYEVQGKKGWKSFRLSTATNPIIDPQELADAKAELPPAIYAQEYEGIPAPDGGNPFGIDAIAAAFGKKSSGPISQWGVDLAKSVDWTVAMGLDAQGVEVVSHRWQGVPWSETMTRLGSIIGNTPALVDSTGVGDPIVEQLQRLCPNVEGFQFSSPSKQKIMEGLAVGLQTQATGFYSPVLKSELDQFGYEYTRTGVRYGAPDGLHDDSVCGYALAYHGLTMRPRPIVWCGEDTSRGANIERKPGETVYEFARRTSDPFADDE